MDAGQDRVSGTGSLFSGIRDLLMKSLEVLTMTQAAGFLQIALCSLMGPDTPPVALMDLDPFSKLFSG